MAFPFAAKIAAQSGPQTEFLRSGADICIYGGAAGGGKTAGLILEPLRHVGRVANFTAVFFRRTMPQITNPGALWDESLNFYPRLGGTPHLRMREWRWPRGGKIKFSHLQFETPTGRVNAGPVTGPGFATRHRAAATDQRHLHPGDGVRQPRSVASQPGISRMAAVVTDTRARAAAGWQLEDQTCRRAVFQTGMVCRRRRDPGRPRRRAVLGPRRH